MSPEWVYPSYFCSLHDILTPAIWSRVYLAGQSAGAHLAACALLMQAEKEVKDDPSELAWRSSQIKAYFAISGG